MIHWKFTYYLMHVVFRVFFRLRIRGKHLLPPKGPYIIAANHKSYTDPILVGLLSSTPMHFMAKEELFRIPVFSNLIRAFNAFPVKREQFDKNAIKLGTNALKSGGKLCVFPEGRRVRDKDIGEIMPGALYMALRAGVPIYPVAIYGADKIIPNGKKIPRLPRLAVEVGEAINLMEVSKDKSQDQGTRAAEADEKIDQKQIMEDGAKVLHERLVLLYDKAAGRVNK